MRHDTSRRTNRQNRSAGARIVSLLNQRIGWRADPPESRIGIGVCRDHKARATIDFVSALDLKYLVVGGAIIDRVLKQRGVVLLRRRALSRTENDAGNVVCIQRAANQRRRTKP